MTQKADSPSALASILTGEDIETVRQAVGWLRVPEERTRALVALDRIERDLDICEQRLAEQERHNRRLHRRLDQGTDRASLMGEITKLRTRYDWLYSKTKPHLDGRCRSYTTALNRQIDAALALVPDRAAGIAAVEEARAASYAELTQNGSSTTEGST